MVIDSAIKSRVVQMAIDGGYGRNQITREFNKQGVKISTTTVTHLIQDWKRQHQQVQYQASVSSIPQKEQQQENKTQETITISREPKTPQCTAINIGMPIIADTGSPSSNNTPHYGDGLKPEPDSEPDPKTLRGPLKFFLNKIVSPTAVVAIAPTTEYNHSIPSNSVNLNVNPIKADEDIPNSNLHSPAPASTLSIPPKAEAFPDRSLFIKDPETEMQVNIIESDTNVKYISKDQDVNSQNETTEEEEREFEQSELQPSLSDSENPLMDWDSDEVWERRFLRIVFDDKKQRRHELLMRDRRKSKLEEWRKRLDQREFNLKDRETRVFEAESYLSVAKKLQEKLQEMKLTLEDALPWIETIREKAEAENIDIRTSGINLTRELRLYRQSGAIQKQIESAKQELALIEDHNYPKTTSPNSFNGFVK